MEKYNYYLDFIRDALSCVAFGATAIGAIGVMVQLNELAEIRDGHRIPKNKFQAWASGKKFKG